MDYVAGHAPIPSLPDYGDLGDRAGARRARRAFRLCVASCVILTGVMWYTDRFLRFGEAERLYVSALALDDDRARPRLLAAIERDGADGEVSTPKYHQALALRDADDFDLDAFEKAYALEPENAMFAIRYGCRLFLAGRLEGAALRFVDADAQPPDNALPQYLEAASRVRAAKAGTALSEAMVIVARTNNSGENIIFPKPLWSSSLRQDGYQHLALAREIVSESTQLLTDLAEQVVATVEAPIPAGPKPGAQNAVPNLKSGLRQILILGERLVDDLAEDGDPASGLQAIAGIGIQLDAIAALERLSASQEGVPDRAPDPKADRLGKALELLSGFEGRRAAIREVERAEYSAPLRLILLSGAGVALAYALALLTYLLSGRRSAAWTVPHSAMGLWILWGGGFLLLLVLHAQSGAVTAMGGGPESSAAPTLWWALLGVLVCFGCLYPTLVLVAPSKVGRASLNAEEDAQLLWTARTAYRQAYAAMALRYYGILAGIFICVACAWLVTFRMRTTLYPWQFDLLPTRLLEEEARIVQQALALL